MVRGFENITAPLSERDKSEIVPCLVRLLEWRKGRACAIPNRELRAELRSRSYIISDAKLRALINYIRTEGLVPRLLANSDGYYVAGCVSECADYCDSLREREAAIRAVRQALEAQCAQQLF